MILFALISILFASDCKKEDDDCHKEIIVVNNSDSTVFISQGFTDVNGDCILDG